MVFVKKLKLFPCFVLMQNRAIKKVVYCFKTKTSRIKVVKISIKKRPKICIFPKGLHHGFCKKKNKTFSIDCFTAKWINKKSCEKFWNKKRLNSSVKNIDFKQAQNFHFAKRLVHGFCQKSRLFTCLVLMQNTATKRVV